MSKKKLTDEEYLKFLNDELSRLNADNPSAFEPGEAWPEVYGSNPDPSGIVEEIKNLVNKPTDLSQERRRNTQNVSGFGRAISPSTDGPRGPLKLNPDGQGTFQSEPTAPTINFVSAPGEKKLVSKNKNAAIILGFDRPSTLSSGLGGKGASNANTIDIVVGRMSCKQEQLSKNQIKAVDPNFFCDASRIYVSQLTDVDLNFGIVAGVAGRGDAMMGKKPASRAAIGLKSDKIRIFGSEGIKIVTGRSYAAGQEEKNSLGGKIPRASPIELIAGNVDGTRKVWGGLFNRPQHIQLLQGVPYGENITDCLLEMQESIDLLTGCVQRQHQLLQSLNKVVAITAFEPWRATVTPIVAMLQAWWVGNALHHLRVNSKLINIGYLTPAGAKYIVSQNVFTT
tara:strand:+ start:11965 stop:13152 length:1188 start_codon:yes stop_codon:yes gene_type:complete